MEAKEYSRLLHLIANAKETAERLEGEMQILTRHGGEGAGADAATVQKMAKQIERGLGNAIDTLRDLGRDKITKTSK